MIRRSVFDSILPRSAVLLLVGAAALSPAAQAQLARARVTPADAPKLLVLPFVRDARDSALSLVVADGVRERLRTTHVDKFSTITRDNLCRVLTESGFPCDIPLEASVSRQVSRFMNARLVIDGSMIRRGDSILVVARLSEASGAAPTAVSASLINSAQRTGAGTGAELANRLVEGFRSFDEVAACRTKLDLQDYVGARRQAESALRQFPGNAGAYLCIARIVEAQGGSPDSVLAALRSAYERDTLNTAVMRSLASKYQAKGDTAGLIDMLRRILTIDFRDNDLRINTIRLLVQMGQVDSAIALVNQGLRENPASAELLGVKAVAMAAGSHWDSAATAMIQVAEIDSSKADSLFFYRLTNYLRQVPDTTGYITWVRNATVKFPTQTPYWYTLAEQSWARADTAGAISAAQQFVALKPEDGRGHLTLARFQVATGQIDSALAHAEAVTDSTLKPFTGPIYLQVGLKFFRDSSYVRAIELLQKAKDNSTGRALVQSAFFLGLSQVYLGRTIDAQADGTHNCDLSRQSQSLWNAAEPNIIAGAAHNREAASQILGQVIPAYKARAEQLVRNNCH
jgi:tetratricopeptide (TPR) repeat protein